MSGPKDDRIWDDEWEPDWLTGGNPHGDPLPDEWKLFGDDDDE